MIRHLPLAALTLTAAITVAASLFVFIGMAPANADAKRAAPAQQATPSRVGKLPGQMLGTWCGVLAEWQEIDKRTFERGKCDPEDDTTILVGPDGYEGTDFSCKIIKINSKREGDRVVYAMRNRCDGEGGPLVEDLSMWLADNGSLILRWKR
jgi:hypothetical protein